MPPNTVKVDRSTPYGNPYRLDEAWGDAAACVALYRQYLINLKAMAQDGDKAAGVMIRELHELRGKNLACWCKPGQPCHADALIDFINDEGKP